jgi:protease secretion system outer membrane protein
MQHRKIYTLLAAIGLAASLPASALGLLEGYHQVLQSDPTLQAARYEHEAGQQEIALGRAGLLPQVSASGSKTHVKGTLEQEVQQVNDARTALINVHEKQYEAYPSWNASLALRQPIFNVYNWFNYQQGKDKAHYSDAVFDGHLKEAATRYLEAYLNVLLAQENIELSTRQIQALKEQQALAKRSFEVGDSSITDVDDAQARLDLAEAQRIESQSALEINLKKLADLTGSPPSSLKAPSPATLALEMPQPASAQAWFDLARKQSPSIKAAEENAAIAKREVQKARAQHLPTLDAFIQADKNSTVPTGGTTPENLSTRTIGLQFNLPIFSGGYTSAISSQALARYEQAQSQLDATTQQVSEDITNQYSGVVNGMSKIKAMRLAVASSEKALDSNKKGFKAGVRANIDILNAEQQLYQAKRDLAQATYTYLLSWVQLKSSAGILSEQDIAGLDRAFTANRVSKPTVAAK